MEDIAVGYSYVVVQFLELPHADIGDYSCVPHSWMRDRRATDRKSLVAYPDESPSITKLRIINGDKPSEKWKPHSYENACEFIKETIHNDSENRYSDVMRIDYKLLPATITKQSSPPLKIINLPDEPCERKHQDQAFYNLQSSSEDLLLRNPYIQQIPKTDNETEVNILGAGSRSTGKTSYTSKDPLTLVNEICDYFQKPQENQSLSIHRQHLHHLSLIQDPEIGLNTSFVIQNPTNLVNQFSQLEISESSPVLQEHSQVLPKQKIPDHSTEVECATSKPTTYSKMTSASHAFIACANSIEHQDSIVEDMVVNELTEVSCINQNVFSETTTENESSANSKALEEVNNSGQAEERRSPMIEAVTSSGILSSQDVDYDEQSNSSELSLDETTTSSNSNEQANRLVTSVLNQADVWVGQLFDLLQKMKMNFSKTRQIAHDLHGSLVQSQNVIERLVNAAENFQALKKGEVAIVACNEVTAEVQQIAEDNQDERKDEENPDVSIEEDKEEDNDVDSNSSENDDDCD